MVVVPKNAAEKGKREKRESVRQQRCFKALKKTQQMTQHTEASNFSF